MSRRFLLRVLTVVVLLFVAGCGDDTSGTTPDASYDAGPIDAGGHPIDGSVDTGVASDTGADATAPIDAATDASTSADAEAETGTDAEALDAAIDSAPDGAFDAALDASSDASSDASADAGFDAAPEASVATYAIGGSVSGLAGTGLAIQMNGTDTRSITSNGTFTFGTKVANGSAFQVTVLTQPSNPLQTCSVANGAGTVSGADITNVAITCVTRTFRVGGTVTGLAAGGAQSVVLENNGNDDLMVSANGAFTFTTPVASGGHYAVTVKSQPASPPQTCSVSGGTGTVGTGDVTGVVVNCAIDTFTVGGSITGLAGTVVLQDNAGDNLALNANGHFAFPTPIASGAAYAVTVLTQPLAPSQTCTVVSGAGTIGNTNVTNVAITCETNTFTIGGTLTGLASGAAVVLQNSGGDNLTRVSNGSFTFATRVASGQPYAVTVLTQPSSPAQACSVTFGSGSVGTGNVTNVTVACTTNQYGVGGTLSGLAAGASVVIQNNGGDSLTLPANGAFAFPTSMASGGSYAVTVASQPDHPVQTCTVTGGTGTVGSANVTSVSINCGTNTFTVGGQISGLAGTVVLQNNGGDNVIVASNGSFAFGTPVPSGGAYAVTVLTQPSSPAQSCVVTQATGTVTNAAITSIKVTCTTSTFPVGGTVTGLAANESVVLQNNGGDDLTVGANGLFTFTTPVLSGQPYHVTVVTNPTSPVAQTCFVAAGSGNVGGSVVANILVNCTPNKYAVGGTVVGLAANDTVILQNNAGDTLPVTSNGAFTFATPLTSNTTYSVSVSAQPSAPITQTCAVLNGAGTVASQNVTTITISCATVPFSVGGTVVGLAPGNTLVLQNSGGDNLNVSTAGAFAFATPVSSGQAYAVTVLTNPSSPIAQICTVSGGTGTVGSGAITSVQVNCSTSSFAVGGTITGLNGAVTLQNNGTDAITLHGNGSFAFPTPIASGAPYSVTVSSNPSSPIVQTCAVSQGSGNVGSAAVGTVVVTCTTTKFAVGGTISGLAPGESLSLQNNSGDTVTTSANGTFTFPTAIASGATYLVTVSSQPSTPVQTCLVASGSGTVGSAAVTSVTITCAGFGNTCPTGTVYKDPFTSNPLGRWTTVVGTWTWDQTNSLYLSAIGSPHTLTWLGARPSWTNYTVDVKVRIDTNSGNGGIVFRAVNTGPANPGNDAGQMYYAGLAPDAVVIGKENNGWTSYANAAGTFNVGTFYNLRVVASGNSFTVSVNGTSYGTYNDSSYPAGSIGLRTWTQGMTYGALQVTCN